MRHHRRAQHADGDIQHGGIGDDRRRRDEEIAQHRPILRPREKHLHAEHRDDGSDQRNHQRFDVAESPALQQQDQQHIEPGNQHAIKQRNVEQQFKRDGRADHFGQVAGRNRDLRADPQHEAHLRAVALAAKLRQVALRGHAQLQS